MQTMEAKESSQGRLGGQRRGVIWGVRTLVDSEAGGGRGYAKEGVGCGGSSPMMIDLARKSLAGGPVWG